MLLSGSNLKLYNLLNLPLIFDPPFVSDGSCLVEGHFVVVSIVPSIVGPVREGAPSVAIVACDNLWGLRIVTLASLEVRFLPVPDSSVLCCWWITVYKVVFHGHGFHIEIAGHPDFTFEGPKFYRPIGVFNPDFFIHTSSSVRNPSINIERPADDSVPP